MGVLDKILDIMKLSDDDDFENDDFFDDDTTISKEKEEQQLGKELEILIEGVTPDKKYYIQVFT